MTTILFSKRIKNKIKCKCIFSEINKEYIKLFKMLNYTNVKVLKGVTPSAITILGDVALIQTYGKEPSCLSIKNQEIAQSFTTFFNTLWKIAKK